MRRRGLTVFLLACGAAARQSDDPVRLARLGAILGMQGKLEESSAVLEKVLMLDSTDAGTRRNLASNQFQLGRLGPAKRNLEIVLKARPGDKTAVLLLGMVEEEMKEYGPAIRHLESAPELVHQRPESVTALARAYYHTSQLDRSLALLRGLAAPSSEAFNLMSWCLYKQGAFQQAVAFMDLAIERAPRDESNYLDLGMMLLSRGKLPVALEVAEKAAAVAPESYQARMLLGLVQARMRHLEDARKTYARAMQLNPTAPEAILALAMVEAADEDKEQSERTFQEALRLFPRSAVLHQEYAKMLLKFGTAPAMAIAQLETALSLDGSLAESHYQLGNLALNDGKLQPALQHLEAAARLKPESSRIHFALARAYRRSGRAEDAARETAAFQKLKADEDGPVEKGDRPGVPRT